MCWSYFCHRCLQMVVAFNFRLISIQFSHFLHFLFFFFLSLPIFVQIRIRFVNFQCAAILWTLMLVLWNQFPNTKLTFKSVIMMQMKVKTVYRILIFLEIFTELFWANEKVTQFVFSVVKRLLIVMVFVVGVHLNIEFMLSLVQCCETPTHINIELKLRILAYLIERG